MSKYVLTTKESKGSRPVAKAISGKHKGTTFFITKRNVSDEHLFEELGNEIDSFIESKDLTLSDDTYNRLVNVLKSNTPPIKKEKKEFGDLYDEFTKFKDEKRDYIMKDTLLQPIPAYNDPSQVQHILVAGKSGRGKTVWVADFIHIWHKLFPKSPIFLISGKDKEDEPAFNAKGTNSYGKNIVDILDQIPINEEWMAKIACTDGVKPYQHFIDDDSGNSLVVFDDVEGMPKPIANAIKVIQESVLKTGRSKGIYSINIRHELLDREKTKALWTECSDVVLFVKNKGLPAQVIEYACKNKLNLNQAETKKLYDYDSRWVMLSQSLEPNFMIGENRITLL
jgi:hypothetical protein